MNGPQGIARPGLEWLEDRTTISEALLGLIWPALEHCLKCSHLFNVLDASNSIGVTERTAYILRVRQLAVAIAKAYVAETSPPSAPQSV